MIPPKTRETKGKIQLAEDHDFWYGVVTSIGELVFEGKEPSLKIGDIVHFDRRGFVSFELASLQGDLDRMMLVRYPHVTSVIDEDTLRRLDLYDFQKERRDLDAGKTVHAA